MIELIQSIEKELEKITYFYDRNNETDESAASWYFELDNPSISGFLWYEDNSSALKIPIISIELILDDLSYYTREELISVFELNKLLMGCSLGTFCPEDAEMLTIVFRTDARDFVASSLGDWIDFTLGQVAGLIGGTGIGARFSFNN